MAGKKKIKPDQLRSQRWYKGVSLSAFTHRSRSKQMGYGPEEFHDKPAIAIINTWSDINQCHSHFKVRVEEVKRGIWQGGGFPIELPAMSLSEPFVKPSTMLYRNMLAMEAEELLRSHPIDGVVLMGGCDKTTPALLMGAASMDIPAIFVPAGPMLRGNYRNQFLGSGTDSWRFWDELRAGTIDEEEWYEAESGIARSPGHCMTMGTASTMTSAAEALGMTLPGAASIPAADSNHARMASATGRRIVDMVWEDYRPSDIIKRENLENAITTVMALGGSTNAAIHLLAIGHRLDLGVGLEMFDTLSRKTPVLADIQPSGRFLMEDFYYSGGLRALLNRIRDLLHTEASTANGKTLGENIESAEVYNDDVIRTRDNPMSDEGGLVVLKGNICPDGAVIKHTAADPKFYNHTGPAVVFESHPDLLARIDDPDLDVTADSVIVMKNAGPVGGPGMPEWGMLPIPKKLLKAGVRDMVRISDARMSGTSYGTCVLHVAPESFVGGNLALIETGDMITLDIFGRTLNMEVSDEELAKRRDAWTPPKPHYPRGYGWMYAQHIQQADKGCDFDYLQSTDPIAEPELHH
ncbi:MAG: dihydroxy-acid dehydratase [Rhodospirillaceae bacterium]|nr:dihydroxy-acid dehydratase [Rhodospirillaceae bacterium]